MVETTQSSPFEGLGTRVVGIVREPGSVKGDAGMVRAVVYDGERNLKVTAWGDSESRTVTDLGRFLLSVSAGERVELAGRMKEDPKYGPELGLETGHKV